MITVPSLNDTSDILDTDMVMITHSDGNTEKISGAELNKRNQVIFSANKTLTGTPLKAGNVVRVCFTQDITGLDTTSVLQLEYNEVDKNVKVNKDGTLVNFVATEVATNTYKYVQAYTVLELLYDGTQFIIIGNPVVISDDGFKYYANGDYIADEVTADNMHSVTSNAVASVIQRIKSYFTTEQPTGGKWIDGKPIYRKVIDCGVLPSNGQKTFQNVMSNTNKIISIQGAASNGIATISLPYTVTNTYINIYCPTKTDLVVEDNSDFSSYYQTYITLEYTKTTD